MLNMKNFITYYFQDSSNKVVSIALGFFLALGLYFSYTDVNGFHDNWIWIVSVGIVSLIWIIANVIKYNDEK